jgi:hypothetical protein
VGLSNVKIIDLNGKSSMHGPVSATQMKIREK